MSGKLSNPCFKSDMIIISQVAARDELIYVKDMNTEWTHIFLFAWHDYDFLQKRSKKTMQAMFVSWMAAQLVALA